TFVKPLDEARAAMAAKRYAEAAEKFGEAARPEAPETIRRAADEGLKEIRTMGEAIVAAAKGALKGGRTRQARPALDLAARQFPSLDCGKEALELIRKLPFPLRTLTFSVDDHTAGRRILHIRGDGACVARIAAPTPEDPALRERRYEFTLDAAGWDELAKLIETHRYFDIRNSTGSGKAEHTSLKVDLWTGVSGRVSKAVGETHADLDPICAWLAARIRTAGEGSPRMEGAFDPAWLPEGFSK
ncbi:MAG TPA: hypothetical protein VJU16_01625, partial [Planctomycetota bacterium]|nr:hypothetical protein [Planctomycetota bacterium]